MPRVKFVNFLLTYLFLSHAILSTLSSNTLSILFCNLSVYDEKCNKITKFLH